MSKSHHRVVLGEFSIKWTGDSDLVELSIPLKMAEDSDLDDLAPNHAPFERRHTLMLGMDGGGMSALGINWSGGTTSFVVVEMDDPTEEALFTHLTTPNAFFDYVDDLNARMDREDTDLEQLRR